MVGSGKKADGTLSVSGRPSYSGGPNVLTAGIRFLRSMNALSFLPLSGRRPAIT